ncbi:MAG: ABC transporter permease [Solirubrobacterales bacterium]|nr:ABC transporter permease [Solirubrobacterales bacterium]
MSATEGTSTGTGKKSPPKKARATASGPSSRAAFRRRVDRIKGDGWGDVLFVPAVLLALILYLTYANEFFLTELNITNILLQAATLAIVAFGLSFVIFAGELDLSVGAGVALVSVVASMVMRDTGSIPLGVATCLAVGASIGLINGLIVTKLKVPSFIATFGMLTIAQGVALALTDGAVVSGVPQSLGNLANEGFLGIRWALWLVIGVFAVLFFVQTQTSFGVRVFAVGGNREASRLSAIPVDRVILLCFVLTGVAVGLGGLVLTSRVQSGQPNAGGLLALTAIAAIVVGGNNLLGGRGSISRTLWGVLLLAVLENGLQLEGVNDDLQRVVIGAVFIAAASAEFFRRRLRRRARAADEAELVAAGSGNGAGAPAAAAVKPDGDGKAKKKT